jgi:lipoprotein-releasing system ATP-binding protein
MCVFRSQKENGSMPTENSAEPVLACRGLCKWFEDANRRLEVLKGIELTVAAGERIAIIGASGAGKTTLLQLLGGLDTASAGAVFVAGHDMAAINNTERGFLRNKHLGFVYQFHHLLPEFSALENVAMPLLMRRLPSSEVRDSATELLERVGLADRLDHRPGELSGGERQRVAVARALVTRPAVVLADEPTGNLDKETGTKVFDLMIEMNAEFGSSLVVVTHDLELAGQMERILRLEQGVLTEASTRAG